MYMYIYKQREGEKTKKQWLNHVKRSGIFPVNDLYHRGFTSQTGDLDHDSTNQEWMGPMEVKASKHWGFAKPNVSWENDLCMVDFNLL